MPIFIHLYGQSYINACDLIIQIQLSQRLKFWESLTKIFSRISNSGFLLIPLPIFLILNDQIPSAVEQEFFISLICITALDYNIQYT